VSQCLKFNERLLAAAASAEPGSAVHDLMDADHIFASPLTRATQVLVLICPPLLSAASVGLLRR
jgi:hypothetical protein